MILRPSRKEKHSCALAKSAVPLTASSNGPSHNPSNGPSSNPSPITGDEEGGIFIGRNAPGVDGDNPKIDGPKIDGPKIDGPKIDGPKMVELDTDGIPGVAKVELLASDDAVLTARLLKIKGLGPSKVNLES